MRHRCQDRWEHRPPTSLTATASPAACSCPPKPASPRSPTVPIHPHSRAAHAPPHPSAENPTFPTHSTRCATPPPGRRSTSANLPAGANTTPPSSAWSGYESKALSLSPSAYNRIPHPQLPYRPPPPQPHCTPSIDPRASFARLSTAYLYKHAGRRATCFTT